MSDLKCGHLVLVVAELLHKLVDLGALNGLVGGELLHTLVTHRGAQQHQLNKNTRIFETKLEYFLTA